MGESHDAEAAVTHACEVALQAFLTAQIEALDAIGHGGIEYAERARRALTRLPPLAPAAPPAARAWKTHRTRGHLRLLGPVADGGPGRAE